MLTRYKGTVIYKVLHFINLRGINNEKNSIKKLYKFKNIK